MREMSITSGQNVWQRRKTRDRNLLSTVNSYWYPSAIAHRFTSRAQAVAESKNDSHI
jgi:hypothetical protein